MSKTKTRADKIASYEEQIAQLQNKMKDEIKKRNEEERKARTKRLCTRHGMLEKHMPDLITLTDEQFESFITRAINTSYGRDTLSKIIGRPVTLPTPAVPKKPAEQKATTASGSAYLPQNPARSEA